MYVYCRSFVIFFLCFIIAHHLKWNLYDLVVTVAYLYTADGTPVAAQCYSVMAE